MQCGHSMCRSCVLRLPHGATCPSTTHDVPVGVSAATMTLNRTLAEEIDDLMIHCAHGCKAAPDPTVDDSTVTDTTVGGPAVDDATVGGPTDGDVVNAAGADTSGSPGLFPSVMSSPGEGFASDPSDENSQGEAIDGFVVDPDGCDAVVRLGSRAEHEATCPFRMVPCPNSPVCAPMRQRNLAQHLLECTNVSCANKDLGCGYTGNQTEVDGHVRDACKYELVKDVLAASETKVRALTVAVEQRDGEIEALKGMCVSVGVAV